MVDQILMLLLRSAGELPARLHSYILYIFITEEGMYRLLSLVVKFRLPNHWQLAESWVRFPQQALY